MAEDYEALTEATIAVAQEMLRPIGDGSHDPELADAVYNSLFDLPGPRRVTARPMLSELQRFQSKLFYGFVEIDACYRSLKNIEVYIGRFPYRGTTVSRAAHLRYHFENHLHEVYLLKERLTKYAKVIARSYKGDQSADKVRESLSGLTNLVENSLKEIVDTRGNHVHSERFSHEEFSTLELLELFDRAGTLAKIQEAIGPFHVQKYRDIRKRWRQRVRANNIELKKLLDRFGSVLLAAIYSGENRKLVPPKNLSSRVS